MKPVQSICFLFCLLLAHASVAQQKIVANVHMETKTTNNNEITYRKGIMLKLSDFEGAEEPSADAVAMAYTGVSLRYNGSAKNGIITLDIKLLASFDKSRSWCLAKSRNEWTLAHEQRHFDITALNACSLLRELKSYTFTKNFEQELNALQAKYKKKNEDEQDIYDAETNHGINRAVQIDWNERITKAIDECSDCYEQ